MKTRLIGLGAALALAVGATTAQAQGTGTSLTLTRDGAPAANVRVQVQPLNGAATTVGTTGLAGDLELALGMINKSARHQIVVYECKNGEYVAVIVEAGANVPDRDDCRRFVLGMFNARTVNAIRADLIRKTFTTTGQSFIGTTRGKAIVGGGALAVLGGAVLLTGNDNSSGTNNQNNQNNQTSSNNGPYAFTVTVASDPGEHAGPIGMPGEFVATYQENGNSFTITPPAGSRFPAIAGTVTGTQLTGEARTTVAGVPNVLSRLAGSRATSGSQVTITGQLTVGAGGELPGGRSIVYNVVARKQ